MSNVWTKFGKKTPYMDFIKQKKNKDISHLKLKNDKLKTLNIIYKINFVF